MKCAASRDSHLWETFSSPLHLLPDRNSKKGRRRTEALDCREVGIVRAYSTVPTASHDWKERAWPFEMLLNSQTLNSVSDNPVQTMLTEAKGLGAGFCCLELINQGRFCQYSRF